MQTYSCTPKAQNSRALIALSVFLFCLLVVSLLLIFSVGILLLNQSLFLLFSAVIVFLIIKYFGTSYTYTVTLMQKNPVLLVTKNQSRRTTPVYRGELSTLKALYEYGKDAECPRPLRVESHYSFLVSIRPAHWQILYFLLEDGSCAALKLECDDAFLTVLREALAYLRGNASDFAEEDGASESSVDRNED